MAKEHRELDPLFAGLAREARQLGLPIGIFVVWMIGGMFLMSIFFAMNQLFLGAAFVLLLYGTLVALTYEDDRGVSYYYSWLKRTLTNDKKHFHGISYDSQNKHVGSMDFKNARLAQREKMEAKHIPYLHHIDNNIIKLVNGDLMATLKLDGLNFETESYDDLANLKNYRNNMFRQLGSRFVIYKHILRKKVGADAHTPISNDFSNTLLERYTEELNKQVVFVNDIYITLVIRKANPNDPPIERLKAAFNGTDLNEDKLIKELQDSIALFKEGLARANPVQLSIKDNNGFKYCETLTFLSYILNLDSHAMPLFEEEIRDYLSYTRKVFKKDGQIQFNCASGEVRAAAIFGLPTNKYPEGTDHKMIDPFLTVKQELIICQSFMMMDRQASVTLTKRKQNQLINTGDDSVSQVVGIDEALDDLASGRTLNGIFNMTVMVHATTVEGFKKGIQEVRTAFAINNMLPKREDLISEPSYFAQLPGNMHLKCRAATINTTNFSGFASLHNTKTGKKDGNWWGTHVAQLTSVSNTPYYFNWHVHDVGHTRVVAPSGGGKTTLLNFLLSASQKFEPYLFHFDYEHSSEVFIRAMGGKHTTLLPTVKTGWNPLQLPDTDENRAFLIDLFSFMVGSDTKELTSREANKIKNVVDEIYVIKPHLRRLRDVIPLFGTDDEGTLSDRLSKWVNDGVFANCFDNEEDSFTIEGTKTFCFEMKYILDNDTFLQAASMYIFHRIGQAMKNDHPFILVLEEGQQYVKNQINKRWLDTMLTTYRRRNGMVVFVSPTPEVLTQDANLRQQFKTSILFPNPKASKETYQGDKGLGCTEKEFDWLKTTDGQSRQFLIKNDTESVISKLDLSKMLDYVHVFSGNEPKAMRVRAFINEGDVTPKAWLPKFTKEYH